MVVGCPKCKTRLKIPDERIRPEGSKFKCPKCAAMLMVRPPKTQAAPKPAAPQAAAPRPAPRPAPGPVPQPAAKPAAAAKEQGQKIEIQATEINTRKILVAHENPKIVEKSMMQLLKAGYLIIPAANGVEAQVQAMKELPFLVMLDMALPKTDGLEIVRRLKEKPETAAIKNVLICSASDPARQRKNPARAYGVDMYLDDTQIDGHLMSAVGVATGKLALAEFEAATGGVQAAAPKPAPKPAPAPEPAPAPAPEPAPAPKPAPAMASVDKSVEKAKRLARTVLSDIDLYSPEKVLESIKAGRFQAVFAEELREGLKHYQNRIPQDIRSQGNFFQLAIDDFIAKKKKVLGLS